MSRRSCGGLLLGVLALGLLSGCDGGNATAAVALATPAVEWLPLTGEESWHESERAGRRAFEAGKLDDAVGYFSIARRTAEEEVGPTSPSVAVPCLSLARTFLAKGNAGGAAGQARSGLSVLEKAGAHADPARLPLMRLLHEAVLAQGDREEAAQIASEIAREEAVAEGSTMND